MVKLLRISDDRIVSERICANLNRAIYFDKNCWPRVVINDDGDLCSPTFVFEQFDKFQEYRAFVQGFVAASVQSPNTKSPVQKSFAQNSRPEGNGFDDIDMNPE